MGPSSVLVGYRLNVIFLNSCNHPFDMLTGHLFTLKNHIIKL